MASSKEEDTLADILESAIGSDDYVSEMIANFPQCDSIFLNRQQNIVYMQVTAGAPGSHAHEYEITITVKKIK